MYQLSIGVNVIDLPCPSKTSGFVSITITERIIIIVIMEVIALKFW